jgi:hypothetical protein
VGVWQPGNVRDHQRQDDPVRTAYGRRAESGTAYSEGRAGYQQLCQQLGRKGKPSSLASALSLATHSGLDKTNVKHFLKPAVTGFFPPADVSAYHAATTCGAAYAIL